MNSTDVRLRRIVGSHCCSTSLHTNLPSSRHPYSRRKAEYARKESPVQAVRYMQERRRQRSSPSIRLVTVIVAHGKENVPGRAPYPTVAFKLALTNLYQKRSLSTGRLQSIIYRTIPPARHCDGGHPPTHTGADSSASATRRRARHATDSRPHQTSTRGTHHPHKHARGMAVK